MWQWVSGRWVAIRLIWVSVVMAEFHYWLFLGFAGGGW